MNHLLIPLLGSVIVGSIIGKFKKTGKEAQEKDKLKPNPRTMQQLNQQQTA